ncbi:ExeM/NucH family extracellular endonuclease [Halovibrio salipaludis]|nr:ExeM/NucH family extracellular endonuclease [Halovibrio salipaludis]
MHSLRWVPVWLVLLAIALWFAISYRFWPLPAAGEAGCHGAVTAVERIQGTAAVTPLDGRTVLTEGIVTADFTAREQLGGYFIQQGTQGPDQGQASRGLFIYAPGADVSPGERLRVRGEAGEYHGMTQLSGSRIEARCGEPGLPEPVSLSLPVDGEGKEALEGMRVRLEQGAIITGLYGLARYGVINLADGRLFQPTQIAEPGEGARQVAERNQERSLLLDDGSRRQFSALPQWVLRHYEADRRLRVGDALEDVEGVLDYRYGDWRLQPTTAPTVRTLNPPPEPLERPEDGIIRVAGFNLQNYFNGDGRGGGFPTARGAESAAAWRAQHQRLVTALDGLAADIIGLVELENDGTGERSAIASLTAGLEGSWEYARPQRRPGDDAIAVGLAWRSERVGPVGEPKVLRSPPFNQGSRPPVAQRFRHHASGAEFLVVVNHFKSKRCGEASGPNAAQGDGEGCWSAHRNAATRRLLQWLEQLREPMEAPNVVLVGDLNAYARETPLSLLEQAGYRNVLAGRHEGPASSYIYRAQSGTLDYILWAGESDVTVEAAGIQSVNADEPPLLHYSREERNGLPEPLTVSAQEPWRASDHDPTWVDLRPGIE